MNFRFYTEGFVTVKPLVIVNAPPLVNAPVRSATDDFVAFHIPSRLQTPPVSGVRYKGGWGAENSCQVSGKCADGGC